MGKLTAAIKEGDKVWVPLAVGKVCGTVVEDRGPLGIGGRHLFRVSVPSDPYEAEDYVLAEDQIERLSAEDEKELMEPLEPGAVKQFLVEGGLISILVRNTRERVWLRRDSYGHVIDTYVEGYSVTGGRVPPALALRGEKIFTPKQDEVIEFVKSFGLTDADARQVVSRVGTAP